MMITFFIFSLIFDSILSSLENRDSKSKMWLSISTLLDSLESYYEFKTPILFITVFPAYLDYNFSRVDVAVSHFWVDLNGLSPDAIVININTRSITSELTDSFSKAAKISFPRYAALMQID